MLDFINILLILLLISCKPTEQITMNIPIAEQIPSEVKIHEEVLIDQYSWLRDPKWPVVTDKKILSYLTAENNYYDSFFQPIQNEKDKIFQELKGMIKLADQSTYVKQKDYYYYSRTEEDKNYPIYCRKHNSTTAEEEIILDVNMLAKDKKFTRVGTIVASPDNKLIAYSCDFVGDENFSINIYDTETNQLLPDQITNTIDNIVWHENQNGFFYTKLNEHWRNDKLYFHKLGTTQDEDILIHHEPDILYRLDIKKSGSKNYVFVSVNGHDTNEVYIIDLTSNDFTPKLFRAKKEKIFYDLDHNGQYFYIYTNDAGAKNFKIARASINDFNIWEDYINEDKSAYLEGFDITNDYLLLQYSKQANPVLQIQNLTTKELRNIPFSDPVFVAQLYSTNFIENDIRINYSSLAKPNTTYSYDYAKGQLEVLKILEIPSGLNSDDYQVLREWADNDGIKIPISLVYKKSLFKHDGSNPLYLYGYGSYGSGVTANFRNKAILLANKGFVFAIAHIRGGDELGKEWHNEAKFLNKRRTFTDFIKSAEYLVEKKYTSAGNIAIAGGSAGGMLIGTVINEVPQLLKVAIAHVPFVDVLNTMLDESLPLTPSEYKEWGNPNDKIYFDYIKSYSPYENIKEQSYPNILVTAGLSDPRVGYWEPAKWVARLRAMKTDHNLILFHTNLTAGHGGASGRFDYLKKDAEEILFIYKMFKISI